MKLALRRVAAVTVALFTAASAADAQTPAKPAAPLPSLPATGGSGAAAQEAALSLGAVFAGEGKFIRSGLVWRVYADRGDNAAPTLVARSNEPLPVFSLPTGNYIVHVAYGFASATKRLVLRGNLLDRLTVSAGGLRVGGAISGTPIPASRLTFSVYVPVGSYSEGRLVVANAKAGELLRLPEGTYHVVSNYGDTNASQRADLKVEAGKITDATLNHRAATVTLKLVRLPGGEAFAGTAFSVLTPGGDVIREAIGAFPSLVLAEGDYVVIARHEGQVYTREFKVESGNDRDIEVVAR
ncbi:hypothetical protein QNA08_14170 [Chelatococcus sp. SYSU_G07232]|uniref:Uncharacterized protein n=1 Tax=Chelatococcus albus TaxID=3047466 RepID=A0ABT7AJ24_9HYPH|nr:hypothetical protein [Chelatococcus sp. SYSU_G07232]MDJ1159380.1 hypothetical protein [Chelatococcus sp. SYSU_G07232]